MGKHLIDYPALGARFLRGQVPNRTAAERKVDFFTFLYAELPDLWCDAYDRMPNSRVEIVQLTNDGYEFLFDVEGERVVAAFGTTRYEPDQRDSKRMSGFLGIVVSKSDLDRIAEEAPSADIAKKRQEMVGFSWRERFFRTHGKKYDRGHFMSHRQGGGLDINLFPQRTDINQGHGALGAEYRAMEKACVANPGTFCFSRPIYDDESWVPTELDYGVLFSPQRMLIKRFPNK